MEPLRLITSYSFHTVDGQSNYDATAIPVIAIYFNTTAVGDGHLLRHGQAHAGMLPGALPAAEERFKGL
jgi:hypothetical protein